MSKQQIFSSDSGAVFLGYKTSQSLVKLAGRCNMKPAKIGPAGRKSVWTREQLLQLLKVKTEAEQRAGRPRKDG